MLSAFDEQRMIFADYLVALRRYVIQESPKPATVRLNRKYMKYLRTNQLNRDYRTEITQMHKNVIKYIRELKNFGRKYWYIVLPVHLALSITYASIFYLASRKTKYALKWLNIEHANVEPMNFKYAPKVSKKTLEDIAITLVLYKITAPIRLASTVVGTKFLVNCLKNHNIVKCLIAQNINNNVEVEHVWANNV